MTYALGRVALTALDQPVVYVDPMVGAPDRGSDPTYVEPSVMITPSQSPYVDGALPPSWMAPMPVDTTRVPQQLPDLVATAQGSLLPLLAVLVGVYAIFRGKGRGSLSWGAP